MSQVILMGAASQVALTKQATFLTGDLMARIRNANLVIRWLRTVGHQVKALHLQGGAATIQVDAAAAGILKATCCGCNWKNAPGGLRICSVIFQGCVITWNEQADNNQETAARTPVGATAF